MKKTSPSSNLKDSDLDREQFLYLTTHGRKTAQPREIEIWFTHLGGRFYVIAEYPTSHWTENVRTCPEVLVRVAGSSFAAHAKVISPEAEPGLHRAVQELSRQKYGWGEGLVVALIPQIN